MDFKEKSKIVQYSLRIPRELLDKLGYIAEYRGRTKNKELEQMIKARISSFEQKYGEIDLGDDSGKNK